MNKPVRLIVGLGNPGANYANTRHNAGASFVEHLARLHGTTLNADKRHAGLCGRSTIESQELRLLIPTTFMNRSGQAVASMAGFFRIDTEQILIAHDELDLSPGVARLKRGGGHGGHNGLRSIIDNLGKDSGFLRLRLGIGHPGSSEQVTPHVLGRPPANEREALQAAIEESVQVMPLVVRGDLAGAMNQLHRFKAEGL